MDRYSGKPFLRLIECYILDKIDCLGDTQRKVLEEMEPKLRSTYGMQGSWQEIVAAQMGFEGAFDSQVHTLWRGYIEHSRASNKPADPGDFAISLVDQNLEV